MSLHALSHWHVLGAGAIGGLWALRLQAIGCTVSLLASSPDVSPRRLCLQADGERHCHDFDTSRGDTPLSPLLVTTKAGSTKAALTPVLDRLEAGDIVLLLQNGMGIDDWLRQQRPDLTLITGITTDGVYRQSRNELVLAGRGVTLLGGETDREQDITGAIARQWSGTGADVSAVSDIRRQRWLKLAVNCAINPLTAVYRCRNGELALLPDALASMDAVCRETAAVMQAEGVPVEADALFARAVEVSRLTANNTSSMLADVLAGRVTEIDFMNGHVAAVAARHGLSTPTNTALVAAIHALHPSGLST